MPDPPASPTRPVWPPLRGRPGEHNPALAAAMGRGQFAFTPLLPMMLSDGVITLVDGSWLATANYVGYLLGRWPAWRCPG